jgi:hypothetical protein
MLYEILLWQRQCGEAGYKASAQPVPQKAWIITTCPAKGLDYQNFYHSSIHPAGSSSKIQASRVCLVFRYAFLSSSYKESGYIISRRLRRCSSIAFSCGKIAARWQKNWLR